jgi:hypothetical protein
VNAYCTRCGAALAQGAAYCGSCGAPVGAGVQASAYVSTGETNGKALASLLCGIGGFVLIPVVLSVLALVFGYGAQREMAERPGQSGAGLAKAGIILGWIGLAVAALGVFMVVIALGTLSHSNP